MGVESRAGSVQIITMATGGRPGEVVIKSESAKKIDLIKELKRLQIQEQNYEKEKQTHLYAKQGHLYKEMGAIHAEETKAVGLLKADKQKLIQHLTKIKNMVRKFQRELKDVKATPEFVERLKEIMEDVEEQMSNFKEHQKEQYDELIREERIASQEVAVMNNKFDSWATLGPPKLGGDKTDRQGGKLASHRDITKDLPVEVAAFERFVAQNGGVRGGWDDYDHATFLKYRNRHKGKPSFIRELIAFLPGKTEEDLRHHELWYQQYLDLNDEKKEAIQKWKEKKEIEKETLMAQAKEDSDSDDDKKKERLEKIIEQERQERKAQLNKWKIDKELERAEKEERELREKLEKARKEEAERSQQEEQRAKVEEFRRQREEEKQQREYMKQIEAEMEYEKRVQATQEVHKYQERALAEVKKKVAKSKAKEEAEKKRKEQLQQSLKAQNEGHVRRDPSRLLQATAGWRERQKDTSRSGGQVFHTQHRAVPTWRQT